MAEAELGAAVPSDKTPQVAGKLTGQRVGLQYVPKEMSCFHTYQIQCLSVSFFKTGAR